MTAVLALVRDGAPAHASGIAVAARRQHEALRRLGVDAGLVLVGDGAAADPAADPAAAVVRLASGAGFPVDPRRYRWLHLHSLGLLPLALELVRRFGLRLAYTAHALVAREPLHGVPAATRAAWQRVQAAALQAADRAVFLCADEAESAAAGVPGLAGKSVVIGHGLAPAPAPGRSRPGADMLFVGRYAVSKGLELLADVVPRVLAAYPAGFRFVGGHGDALGAAIVRRLCAAHPGRCVDEGWRARADVDAFVAGAALVLVPSRYEPFGLVALEAMALGTPVLAAAVGGLRAQMQGEPGGECLASRDPAAWSERALRIATDPQLHARLAERGPRHVRARFPGDDAARRLVAEVYGGAPP